MQIDLTRVTVGKMADMAKISFSRQKQAPVGVVSSTSIKGSPASFAPIDTTTILPSHVPHVEHGRLDVRVNDFYTKYNDIVAERGICENNSF